MLDENQTGRFGYQVDRPVVDDGAILDVGWTSGDGYGGLLFFGAVDRLYGRPSAGLGGAANVASNWLLSQPEGLLTPSGGKPVALRPVTAAGSTPAETPVGVIDGRFRIVDAGSAASPRLSSLKDAVAVVSGACTDLTATANALAKAGAAAMVAYAASGAECAGTIDGPAGLPTLQAKPWDAKALLAGQGGRAELVTTQVARLHVRPGEVLG